MLISLKARLLLSVETQDKLQKNTALLLLFSIVLCQLRLLHEIRAQNEES